MICLGTTKPMTLFSGYRSISFPHNFTSKSSHLPLQMINNCFISTFPSSTSSYSSIAFARVCRSQRKLPILLLDVMDTIVRDPFYHDVPDFFRMSLKELIDCKHPTAWVDFEKGLITEIELSKKFFKDGRLFDIEGLKACMRRGYSYTEGIEALLDGLRQRNYEMHAFTNYPIWYEMIEDKLKLSSFVSWTFCSCIIGKRKPDPESYLEVLKRLHVESACCVFIDDRLRNMLRQQGIVV